MPLVSNLAQDLEDLAADETPDPAVLRAERRLRLLEELAEIGMELARALRPVDGAADAEPAAETGRGKLCDPTDAFARISRAIRLTLALEAKTDEALRDLKSGVARERKDERVRATAARAKAAAKDLEAYDSRVCDLVLSVAEAEIEDGGDYGELFEALEERLAEDQAYSDLHAWPLRETVERLCKDLALTPDWSRWDGEGWIDAPVRSRYSPFNRPSAKPLMIDGEWPPQEQPPPEPQPRAHDLE